MREIKTNVGFYGECTLKEKTAEELEHMEVVYMGYDFYEGEMIHVYMGINEIHGKGYFSTKEMSRS